MNMVYGEWLRVRTALKVTAIVFGILLVLAVLLRISFAQFFTYGKLIDNMTAKPGTTTVHLVLHDGTHRTIVQNKQEHMRIVIDKRPHHGSRVVITEPATTSANTQSFAINGSVDVHSSKRTNIKTTTIQKDGPTGLSTYIANALFVAFILATALSGPFARENNGHLEIALTKPIGRTPLALQIMGMDALGIIAGFVIAMIGVLAGSEIFTPLHLAIDSQAWTWLGCGLLLALTWYALLTAATASLKRGSGAVIGFAWPVAIVITAINQIPFGDSLIGLSVHNIFKFLAFFDPIAYINSGKSYPGVLGAAPTLWLAAVVGLFIIYIGAAVVQWQRVEA